MRVLILGCGPAGLIAAHAAEVEGCDVVVMSRKRKSPMRGAQYLHHRIPGLPASEIKVTYGLVGTIDGYREKVYGPDSEIVVSPEKLMGVSRAWDIRAVYNDLWRRYRDRVEPLEVYPDSLVAAIDRVRPALTISTVPAYLLCYGGCRFDSTSVGVSETADFLDGYMPDKNIVVCSGLPDHRWYRQSRIAGWSNTEYPSRALLGLSIPEDVARITKPISTDCTCLPQIHRMGRYGRWEKSVLSDSAYEETKELIHGAQASRD